jgi:hypothetical protein
MADQGRAQHACVDRRGTRLANVVQPANYSPPPDGFFE